MKASTWRRCPPCTGCCATRRGPGASPAGDPPELLATEPNEVWSWDITKLLGPAKWAYYYLYVILDIFSRYVPGWMLAHAENAKLAEALLADTVAKQNIEHGQLSIHADRGSPMIAKPVAFLLADFGVTKSHSRPHCSNDNPFSESQFRTLKYRPQFPERFGCYQDAHAFCSRFFGWYNHEHRHSGIGFHTPPTSTTGGTSSSEPSGPRSSRRGLGRTPRTLRSQATRTARAAERRVDQRTEGGHRYNAVIGQRNMSQKG
jgi:putative transposase